MFFLVESKNELRFEQNVAEVCSLHNSVASNKRVVAAI